MFRHIEFLVVLFLFLALSQNQAFRHSNNNRISQFRRSLSSIAEDEQDKSNKVVSTSKVLSDSERKDLWKSISSLEKTAVDLLCGGQEKDKEEAYKLLSQSITLKKSDPFLHLAESYGNAVAASNEEECQKVMAAMKIANVPPHLSTLAALRQKARLEMGDADENEEEGGLGLDEDDIDPGSTFSDTVTEKVRVKVSSFFDADKSDPENGKYMFWYKVAIYNEGPEPVQIVARMWEIEKCKGDKEVVRGAGIMSTQPIIPPGDVFTYQSVCPLKVFPPKGRRLLGSMSGAYTLCKGNMGQHNFTVKVSKFNLILPEAVAGRAPSTQSPST